MTTAISQEVSTIKPAGGGDYTTLATWWAAKKSGGVDSDVAAWAECYGGGNMGAVDVDGAGYLGAVDYYTRIYAASGERHDGTFGSSGAYIEANSGYLLTADENYIRVEGLRLVAKSDATHGFISFQETDVENVLVDGVVVENRTGAGLWGFYLYGSTTGTRQVTARNCLAYGEGLTTGIHAGIIVRPAFSDHVVNATLQNCSISRWSADGSGVLYYDQLAGTTVNATTQNVVCTGNGTDFKVQGGGTTSIAQTYCLSQDDTADDWGGTGNLVSRIASDVFETPASDLNLKTGSPAISSGTNLYSTFTTDAVAATRRQADAWDMGALTTGLISEVIPATEGLAVVGASSPLTDVSAVKALAEVSSSRPLTDVSTTRSLTGITASVPLG